MSAKSKPTARGPIPGHVVGQYFGFFNGVPKQRYDHIVATAPFDKCNLLILAFVHTVKQDDVYVAQFTNWRDNRNKYPATPGDTDQDRVKLVVKTARARKPSIKILISLGWGESSNDAGRAAATPVQFADSVVALVQTYDLDGFDIDFESTDVEAKDMLTLAQRLKASLAKVRPGREKIMTITPAQTDGLDGNVLKVFTYTMPQTYDHGGNGTTAAWYKRQLGSCERIVYGLNAEGYIGESDDPRKFAAKAHANHAAGIFAWRLDNDSVDRKTTYPTFATGIEMWGLMKSGRTRPAARTRRRRS
jgi:GH18 family chitinase